MKERKWDNLTKEEQEMFEEVAEHWGKTLAVMKDVIENGCFMCRFRPQGVAELEFHLQTTHGLPEGFIARATGENE